ncbi:MAG: (2Fe-2S)-binding protein [Myxococcota bacterium]|jgi:aerobic-type carbon monoxide dehydrogenase small subunit (CoxS/CutS family)|nr:(2Fe-2S)-binding protein [Myxococcota bacterium]
MQVRMTINGTPRTLEVEPTTTLLDALRDAGYKGVKVGCREAACGACTVLVDGKARLSCILFAAQLEGREVTTIEGLGTPDAPHPLQQAFVEVGAVQCGYCTPGTILSAKALLDGQPAPSEAEIREALDGNLCRCTGYVKMIDAVNLAASRLREEKP